MIEVADSYGGTDGGYQEDAGGQAEKQLSHMHTFQLCTDNSRTGRLQFADPMSCVYADHNRTLVPFVIFSTSSILPVQATDRASANLHK